MFLYDHEIRLVEQIGNARSLDESAELLLAYVSRCRRKHPIKRVLKPRLSPDRMLTILYRQFSV